MPKDRGYKYKHISEAIDATLGEGFHQVAEIDSLPSISKTPDELMSVPGGGGVPDTLVMKPPFYHAPFPERDNPAKSAKQQKLMGAALAMKRGKAKSKGKAAEIAEDMPEHKIREFARRRKKK